MEGAGQLHIEIDVCKGNIDPPPGPALMAMVTLDHHNLKPWRGERVIFYNRFNTRIPVLQERREKLIMQPTKNMKKN
jgi:hypothetical protein